MTNSSIPAPPPNPFATFGSNPCGALPALRAAYYSLLAGANVHTVRFGDQIVTFNSSNVKELSAEIQRLEAQCEAPRRRARRAGPYTRIPGYLAPPFGVGFPYGW